MRVSIGRSAASGAVAAVTTVGLGMLVVGASLAPVNEFTFSHYLFTYQDGFVRRALVGSIIAFVTGDTPVPVELALGLGVVYMALLVGLVAVLVALATTRGSRTTALLLGGLFVGSSQLRILAFDAAKFDSLLLVFTAAATLASLAGRRTAQIVAIVLGVVGVLVHELHLVAGVPIAATMVALRHGQSGLDRLRIGLVTAAPAGLLGAGIALTSGELPGGSMSAATDLIAARAALPITESGLYIHDLSLVDGIVQTFGWIASQPFAVLATLVTAAPAAVAAVLLLRSAPGVASTPRTTQPHLLLLAASSPLLLLPLGFDWYRWVTLAVVNLVLAGLWHQAARPAGDASGDAAGRDVRMDGPGPAVIGAVLIAIVLGGLSPLAGVTGLLDVVR